MTNNTKVHIKIPANVAMHQTQGSVSVKSQAINPIKDAAAKDHHITQNNEQIVSPTQQNEHPASLIENKGILNAHDTHTQETPTPANDAPQGLHSFFYDTNQSTTFNVEALKSGHGSHSFDSSTWSELASNSKTGLMQYMNISQANTLPSGDTLSISLYNQPSDILFTVNGNPASASPNIQANIHPSENFFINAASSLTGLFTSGEKAHAQTVAPFNNKVVTLDASSFIAPDLSLIPTISHQAITGNQIAINGEKTIFEDGNNHLFTVSPSALTPFHSTGIMNTLSLHGAATGIVDTPYFMRAAGTSITAITPGGSVNTPGFIVDFFLSNPPPAVSGTTKLLLLQDQDITGQFAIIAQVPASIDAKVSVPANSLLVYNQNLTSGLLSLSDYSLTSSITSVSGEQNLGNQGTNSPTGFVINTSLHLAILDFVAASALIDVTTSSQLKAVFSFFTKTAGIGTLIDEGQYSYTKTGDVNGDSYSDMIFGGPGVESAILLYGPSVLNTAFPTFLSLSHVTSPYSATQFNIPQHDIVGTPLADGAIPLDHGAALNALSNTNAGANFAGDLLGNGGQGVLIERFSSNYAFDSDLVYVIYGHSGTNFASSVQLLQYGDSKLNSGIVGIDNLGNYVHGFTITGQLNHGTVAPASFSVKSVGDLNADGYSDLAVLSNNNTGYLIFGHPEINNGSSNINLGTPSPYVLSFLNLPTVAGSALVPTIDDIKSGLLNNDGLGDLLFNFTISSYSLQNQAMNYANYLTSITNKFGTELGTILSGAFLTDSTISPTGAPIGSSYAFINPVTGLLDTSHILTGFNNQGILHGTSGIDDLIGGTNSQILLESGKGATNPNLPGVVGSTLIGGNGNTIFEVADTVFHEVKGGIGFNTLRLDSGSLDLTQVSNPSAASLAQQADHQVFNIARIELGDQVSLTINTDAVLTDNNTPTTLLNPPSGTVLGNLLIAAKTGATGASVTLVNDAQHTWTLQSGPFLHPPQIDGHSLLTYTSVIGAPTSGSNAATVVVENNVAVHTH